MTSSADPKPFPLTLTTDVGGPTAGFSRSAAEPGATPAALEYGPAATPSRRTERTGISLAREGGGSHEMKNRRPPMESLILPPPPQPNGLPAPAADVTCAATGAA